MRSSSQDILKKYQDLFFEDFRGSNTIHFEDTKENISFKESFSKKNAFRGMHLQIPPNVQKKYIRVVSGKIEDYVIPLNSNRKDYGPIHSFILNENSGFFEIPIFCAHGFKVLEDTNFMYICIGNYSEKNELSIALPNQSNELLISPKDQAGMSLEDALEHCKSIDWEKSKI